MAFSFPILLCWFAVFHPASRASFNFPAAEIWEEKEALHKSCHFVEVAAAPKFGLLIGSPSSSNYSSEVVKHE